MAGWKSKPGNGLQTPSPPLLCHSLPGPALSRSPQLLFPSSACVLPSWSASLLRYEKGHGQSCRSRDTGPSPNQLRQSGMSRHVFILEPENTHWLLPAPSQSQPGCSTLPRTASTERGVPGPPSLRYVCVCVEGTPGGLLEVARVRASRGCSITTSKGGQCRAAGSTVTVWWPEWAEEGSLQSVSKGCPKPSFPCQLQSLPQEHPYPQAG